VRACRADGDHPGRDDQAEITPVATSALLAALVQLRRDLKVAALIAAALLVHRRADRLPLVRLLYQLPDGAQLTAHRVTFGRRALKRGLHLGVLPLGGCGLFG
jgi:hypothetical protein